MIDDATNWSQLAARIGRLGGARVPSAFYLTPPAPCPYVPGRMERKIFTELRGPGAPAVAEALGRIGFRRSQTIAYRPACDACHACVPVRVPLAGFTPTRAQRRVLRAAADLVATERAPWSTPEQYGLLRRYLALRHPAGGMSAMDAVDYADMVEQTPVDTRVIEYREPGFDGAGGALVGAAITDVQADGLSMIYSFYDAAHPRRRGLGTFMVLDHAARAKALGLPYLYLGYWIEGARRMAYKATFRPLERLGRAGWAADGG